MSGKKVRMKDKLGGVIKGKLDSKDRTVSQ